MMPRSPDPPALAPVFYLGPAGTFCHQAALRVHSDSPRLIAAPSIPAVFEAVSEKPGSQGVVPIENSIEGSVNLTLEALLEYEELRLTGEVVLEIEQCLISEGTLSQIQSVHSHSHALPQCRKWLRQHLPSVQLVAEDSTAKAALLTKGHPERAAIASALAANLSGVPVLHEGIQDRKHNATRFLTLGYHAPERTGFDKTSIVFGAPHEKGALFRVLAIFDQHDVNLSRIESRPLPDQAWQYLFFADLEGHQSDPNVANALQQLQENGATLRIFGSYPRVRLAPEVAEKSSFPTR